MNTRLRLARSRSNEESDLYKMISSKTGRDVAEFVYRNISEEVLNTNPLQVANWALQEDDNWGKAQVLIDFKDVSQAIDLGIHFASINRRLKDNGIYVGCFESNTNWKNKVFSNYNRVIGWSILLINYLFRNFVPGWKKISRREKYFIDRLYHDASLAEVLGRVVYSGFEIVNYLEAGGLTYFILMKKTPPRTDFVTTSRFIVKLSRVGKGGKIIRIYKLRTMYPFSEFIQDYVVKMNGYDNIGKPKNDFRLTSCGKVIRKLWIDEIPQLINLVRGDIKIVGVRPISRYGFYALPRDLQQKRIRYKPGLIPPSASLRIKGFKGVINAENQYLEEKEKRPLTTDVKYFFLAFFNILTFRVKSA
jgi:lipopolysaccharide/colanic/teichoic acid biosynthesis glycosyltransferase